MTLLLHHHSAFWIPTRYAPFSRIVSGQQTGVTPFFMAIDYPHNIQEYKDLLDAATVQNALTLL
jgi:hypothetical protein